jgi:hypothetical protein
MDATETSRKIINHYQNMDYVTNFIYLCFFIFSALFLNYYFDEAEATFAKNTYTHYFFILVILLVVGMYFYKNPDLLFSIFHLVSRNPLLISVIVTGFILFVFSLYTFLSTENSNTYYWSGQIVDIMTILIIAFVTVVMFFKWNVKDSLSQRGMSGLLSQMLMYLPCKIEDILVAILGDFMNTPITTYVLLGIEILLLIWIFKYRSSLTNWFVKQTVFSLLNDPVYLNETTPITSYSSLSETTGISNQTVAMNYGISFWFYLNTNNQHVDRELPIFMYGGGRKDISGNCSMYSNQNVHPAITFIRTSNQEEIETSENIWEGAGLKWSKGHLKIYFSDCSPEKENSMIIDVPLQKWNYLTLNYSSQKVDVFLNGEIMVSHTFTEPPIYSLGDSIQVGGNNLQGAIQDIQYSTMPFSKSSISMTYNNNLLKYAIPTFIFR